MRVPIKDAVPIYEPSSKDSGCVTITLKNRIYFYDLKKFTYYDYQLNSSLTFKMSGQPEEKTVSGFLAKCLYQALTDWHKGRIQ